MPEVSGSGSWRDLLGGGRRRAGGFQVTRRLHRPRISANSATRACPIAPATHCFGGEVHTARFSAKESACPAQFRVRICSRATTDQRLDHTPLWITAGSPCHIDAVGAGHIVDANRGPSLYHICCGSRASLVRFSAPRVRRRISADAASASASASVATSLPLACSLSRRTASPGSP